MKKVITAVAAAAVVVSLGLSGLAFAQEAETTASPAHVQAAEEFLMAMQTPQQLEEGINSMVELMLQSQPTMIPYRTTIKDFYAQHLSWNALKDQYVGITTGLLSEEELKKLTAFFQTEVGKKFIEKQPEMFQKTAELGYQVMQENQDELIDLLEAAAQQYAVEEEEAEAEAAE